MDGNKEPLVSVIVPVYNVEQYLERCVFSLINQTMDNIEIILVDDGSSDKCPQLCDEYSDKYKNVKTIHKINGGLSSARNAGIKVAKGKYVAFVDSDDDVELNMYEKMYKVAESKSVDFVMSDYVRIMQNGQSFIKTFNINQGVYDKNRIVNVIYPQLIMGNNLDYGPLLSVCHCLYKRSLLIDNNIFFDEEVKWSEDNLFSSIVGYKANKFYYMKGEGLYHYYQNPGTITTSYKKGSWDVYKIMNERLKEFFCESKQYDFSRQLKLHIIYYACNCISHSLELEKRESLKEIKNILCSEELKDAFKDFKFPDVMFKLKVELFLMKYKMTSIIYYLLK